MPAAETRPPPSEVNRLGTAIYERDIKPRLKPEDDGKFIAIDVHTGEYELDADEIPAIDRLRARRPGGHFLLLCVGQKATYRWGPFRQ